MNINIQVIELFNSAPDFAWRMAHWLGWLLSGLCLEGLKRILENFKDQSLLYPKVTDVIRCGLIVFNKYSETAL